MRNVIALVFLMGCSGSAVQQLEVASAASPDMAEAVIADPVPTPDGASATIDMYIAVDASQAVDMAHAVDMTQSIPDMAQLIPPSDLASCDFVPQCSAATGGSAGCCNGALECINGNCLNTVGQYCNTNPNYPGPLVACYQSHPCGTDHKCT